MKTNTELLKEQMFEINDLPIVEFEVEETNEICLEIKWYDEYLDMDYIDVIRDYFGDKNPNIYSFHEFKNSIGYDYFKIYIVDRRNKLPF